MNTSQKIVIDSKCDATYDKSKMVLEIQPSEGYMITDVSVNYNPKDNKITMRFEPLTESDKPKKNMVRLRK